jgi:uncharacterized membrane protein
VRRQKEGYRLSDREKKLVVALVDAHMPSGQYVNPSIQAVKQLHAVLANVSKLTVLR